MPDVLSWDHHEEPDWEQVSEALSHWIEPHITVVQHTGDDQCAIVIGPKEYTQEEATQLYEDAVRES